MEKRVDDFAGINEGGDIPEHRIQYFRRVGSEDYEKLVFWDRNGRVDRLFGSGNGDNPISQTTVQNVISAVATMRRLADEQKKKQRITMEEIFKFKLRRTNNDDEPTPIAAKFLDLLHSDPHPAQTIDYDQLMAGLQRAVEKKTVLAKKDKTGKLTIYNYIANTWGFFECLARGLVIDEEKRTVVATPFPKFFNYGEMSNSFPTGPFQAAEKMDGSLGVTFWYEGDWHVATRGSFQSRQAEWATQWFRSNVAPKLPPRYQGSTILVEIIYPENKIVIGYDFSALVLLGAYHENGQEYTRAELKELAATVQIRLAELYQFGSVEDVLQSAMRLPANKEGWVLRFPSGYRMKVKGDEYCNLHRSISSITPLNIWAMMKENQSMKDFADSIPEEFAGDLKKIVQTLDDRLEECLEIVKTTMEATQHLSPKDLGPLNPKSKKNKKGKGSSIVVETILVPSSNQGEEDIVIPAWTLNYLFQSRRKEFQENDMLEWIRNPPLGNLNARRLREKIFDLFRPANNSLDGYSPAGVANRFVDIDEGS